ncbi:hypothetical protein JOF56_009769 [Kibdelosporangium banguiense]|uniref:OmpR/PhoB-type domain-containing protein n=1 Tax=Kibdelosporangium banguiense TaxID=1365924 RepID=A0ABS4TYB5_9PSEU|nr:helix-turn-helix domain-containing protein [Kibdelosporangium banguiense]MBP2329384.1 hypothetical protein [Kibdelosporangium banguiense]
MQAEQSGVALIRWPEESERRIHCRAKGVPRLLVVEGGHMAPVSGDAYEDWVRMPVSESDVHARISVLRARLTADCTPRVDAHGVLHFRSRSLVLSPTGASLANVLAASFEQVVRRETMMEWLSSKQNPSRSALDLHIMRLRRRIWPLDLAIRTVWGRGYVLEYSENQSELPGPE